MMLMTALSEAPAQPANTAGTSVALPTPARATEAAVDAFQQALVRSEPDARTTPSQPALPAGSLSEFHQLARDQWLPKREQGQDEDTPQGSEPDGATASPMPLAAPPLAAPIQAAPTTTAAPQAVRTHPSPPAMTAWAAAPEPEAVDGAGAVRAPQRTAVAVPTQGPAASIAPAVLPAPSASLHELPMPPFARAATAAQPALARQAGTTPSGPELGASSPARGRDTGDAPEAQAPSAPILWVAPSPNVSATSVPTAAPAASPWPAVSLDAKPLASTATQARIAQDPPEPRREGTTPSSAAQGPVRHPVLTPITRPPQAATALEPDVAMFAPVLAPAPQPIDLPTKTVPTAMTLAQAGVPTASVLTAPSVALEAAPARSTPTSAALAAAPHAGAPAKALAEGQSAWPLPRAEQEAPLGDRAMARPSMPAATAAGTVTLAPAGEVASTPSTDPLAAAQTPIRPVHPRDGEAETWSTPALASGHRPRQIAQAPVEADEAAFAPAPSRLPEPSAMAPIDRVDAVAVLPSLPQPVPTRPRTPAPMQANDLPAETTSAALTLTPWGLAPTPSTPLRQADIVRSAAIAPQAGTMAHQAQAPAASAPLADPTAQGQPRWAPTDVPATALPQATVSSPTPMPLPTQSAPWPARPSTTARESMAQADAIAPKGPATAPAVVREPVAAAAPVVTAAPMAPTGQAVLAPQVPAAALVNHRPILADGATASPTRWDDPGVTMAPLGVIVPQAPKAPPPVLTTQSLPDTTPPLATDGAMPTAPMPVQAAQGATGHAQHPLASKPLETSAAPATSAEQRAPDPQATAVAAGPTTVAKTSPMGQDGQGAKAAQALAPALPPASPEALRPAPAPTRTPDAVTPVPSTASSTSASSTPTLATPPASADGLAVTRREWTEPAAHEEGPEHPAPGESRPMALTPETATMPMLPREAVRAEPTVQARTDLQGVRELVSQVRRTLAQRDLDALDAGRTVSISLSGSGLPVERIELTGDGSGGLAAITLVTHSASGQQLTGKRTEELSALLRQDQPGLRLEVRAEAPLATGQSSAQGAMTGGSGQGQQGSSHTSREDLVQALDRIQRRSMRADELQAAAAHFERQVVSGS